MTKPWNDEANRRRVHRDGETVGRQRKVQTTPGPAEMAAALPHGGGMSGLTEFLPQRYDWRAGHS
jgi:hypothetical protein